MIRYWRALLGGRFKLWQLIALGFVWIALGAAVGSLLGNLGSAYSALFMLSGVGHWVIAAIGLRMHEQIDEKLAVLDARNEKAVQKREQAEADLSEPPIPVAPKAPSPAPQVRPAPPRIGNDPFRDPPAGTPLAVIHTATPPRAVPVVRAVSESGDGAENPDEKPKFLV